MSNITPRIGKIYLLPIKKSVTTSTGIILEEDKGELLTDTYEVMFDCSYMDLNKEQNLAKGDRVICSDMSGINVIIQWQMIKIVDNKDILWLLS